MTMIGFLIFNIASFSALSNRLEITGDRGKIVAEGNKLTFHRTETSVSQFLKEYPGGFGSPGVWTCDRCDTEFCPGVTHDADAGVVYDAGQLVNHPGAAAMPKDAADDAFRIDSPTASRGVHGATSGPGARENFPADPAAARPPRWQPMQFSASTGRTSRRKKVRRGSLASGSASGMGSGTATRWS